LDELTSIVLRNAERHDRQTEKINATLNRAIRLGVREFRRQRVERVELEAKLEAKLAQAAALLDEKLTQLAAAQLVTEEKLQRFLQRSPNGKSWTDQ
jgi:hypothetical protein